MHLQFEKKETNLNKQKEIYPKSESFLKLLGPQSPAVLFLGGKNVGFVNGDAWRKQRKVKQIIYCLKKSNYKKTDHEPCLPSFNAYPNYGQCHA